MVSTKELLLLNCSAGEDSWESLGQHGNQTRIFTGRTDAEAEAPVLQPPDWRANSLEEKGVPKSEMVGWHHQLNGHEFEKPDMLQSIGLQRVRHEWATEQQQQHKGSNSLLFINIIIPKHPDFILWHFAIYQLITKKGWT